MSDSMKNELLRNYLEEALRNFFKNPWKNFRKKSLDKFLKEILVDFKTGFWKSSSEIPGVIFERIHGVLYKKKLQETY